MQSTQTKHCKPKNTKLFPSACHRAVTQSNPTQNENRASTPCILQDETQSARTPLHNAMTEQPHRASTHNSLSAPAPALAHCIHVNFPFTTGFLLPQNNTPQKNTSHGLADGPQPSIAGIGCRHHKKKHTQMHSTAPAAPWLQPHSSQTLCLQEQNRTQHNTTQQNTCPNCRCDTQETCPAPCKHMSACQHHH